MGFPSFVVSLGAIALADAAGLARIPIAMLGRWVKSNQKFSITREDLAQLVENFRKRKTGEAVIDYEHASEFPEVAQGQPVPAAGWLKSMEDGPDEQGILWGLAEFTKRARELISGREYKYLSPAIDWGARDKGTGTQQGATLTSLALVNRPFLEALPAIQLSEAGWGADEGERRNMPDENIFNDLNKLDEHLHREVVRRMGQDRVGYREALLAIAAESPALIKLREALYRKREYAKHDTKFYKVVEGQLVEVEEQIGRLVREAAREHPELSYGGAMKMVAASDHGHLFRTREQLKDWLSR